MRSFRHQIACSLAVAVVFAGTAGCSPAPAYQDEMPTHDVVQPEETAEAVGSADVDGAMSQPDVDVDAEIDDGARPSDDTADADVVTQMLIYTGSIVLAVYKVDERVDAAIELTEELGGYVAELTSRKLTLRVPSESFRDAMDALSELGDVLDSAWQAHDVAEEYRDLQVRLQNALDVRDRLAQLLDETETIEEALRIEEELQRVIAEIEEIRSELEFLEHRTAYSTIEVEFRAIEVEELPDDRVQLPFRWLDDLGIESLLEAPERYR